MRFEGFTINVEGHTHVLGFLLTGIANGDVSGYLCLREVGVRYGLHLIVGDMHQGAHPQLHLTEDAAQAPHILTFQVRAVVPSIHLDSKFVLALVNVFRHVELCRRHRVLAISHLLTIHPHIHRRMNATEVQNQILREHLFRGIKEGDIRTHRVAMVVGIPVFVGYSRDAGTIAMERIL